MKIAQVAPLYESVPPKGYGGTERIVSYLTEELVEMGHEVTLFASGDSQTKATLISPCEHSLRSDHDCIDPLAHHIMLLEYIFQFERLFDIIHFHIDYLHFPLSRRELIPTVTTLHGRLDLPDLNALYKEFSEIPVVSISNSQRSPLPWANWQSTVYHGLPLGLYSFQESPEDYLLFLGRVSPEKRLDRAIEIAEQTKTKLKVAAKIDKVDQDYFNEKIKDRLLHSKYVEFLGEVGEHDKKHLLERAKALLFPINWPEPFGLVMIEALACGTPVIAFHHGSVPEVIIDGLTGFIVNDIEEACVAVQHLNEIDRRTCRQFFEDRYSSRRMAEDYVKIYEQILQRNASLWSGNRRYHPSQR